jgi:clumping factor A
MIIASGNEIVLCAVTSVSHVVSRYVSFRIRAIFFFLLSGCHGAVAPAPEIIGNGENDTDRDGLTDRQERRFGSDPFDADSDDDGIWDGAESGRDSDGDGLIDALDPDSDNDGLLDGTEAGLTFADLGRDTRRDRGAFFADRDSGRTTTSPVDRDSDDDGVPDGAEDPDGDGVAIFSAGSLADATAAPAPPSDRDRDWLSDAEEIAIGSDPTDADSDDDGILDGAEPNPRFDSDRDGRINALDPDSDGDGLCDGMEVGLTVADLTAATDLAAGHFHADADAGLSTTSVVDRDSDHGGLTDGEEDLDRDGMWDGGEGDPSHPSDDLLRPV